MKFLLDVFGSVNFPMTLISISVDRSVGRFVIWCVDLPHLPKDQGGYTSNAPSGALVLPGRGKRFDEASRESEQARKPI